MFSVCSSSIIIIRNFFACVCNIEGGGAGGGVILVSIYFYDLK